MSSEAAVRDASSVLHRALMVIVPAGLVCVAYGYFLDYRRDYLGHFAAGYGATLAGGAAALAMFPRWCGSWRDDWLVVAWVVVSIGLGAVLEGSVFRIARFDPVDFCNQSLGAALAGVALLAWLKRPHARIDSLLRHGIVIGVIFLGIGAFYAFT